MSSYLPYIAAAAVVLPIAWVGLEAVYIALRTPILPGAKGAFSERLLPDAVTESDAAATKPNGKAKSAAVEKKQQHTQLDTLRILVLGDSLAEGVGLLTNDLSVCGRMVHALQAQLNPSNSDVKPIIIEQVTIAKSGYWADRMEKKLLKRIPANFIDPQMRLKASESHVAPAEFELKPETDVAFGGRVQTIVILSNGANSAVRMHSARAAAKELKSLAKAIHEKLGPGSEEVPIFHLGMPPLHLFPALPPLISRIIGWRERSVARAIKQVCDTDTSHNLHYIEMPDLFSIASQLHASSSASAAHSLLAYTPGLTDRLASIVELERRNASRKWHPLFSRDRFHLGDLGCELLGRGVAEYVRTTLLEGQPPSGMNRSQLRKITVAIDLPTVSGYERLKLTSNPY